ncbi:PHD finger protein MALE STERILITY 1 [Momordica charantia]|uniref:PHD finger protein MALE STERILITY 1 n=1 Tax=Momordica charantia TaxID=3673 RepID=A0A6J1DTQ4_MOMCH|nr:PHD finger protein MALE STERILITY 1 [Momordica charantia]
MAEAIGRKRRRGAGGGGEKVFRFKSFGENGYPVEFVGRFRENVVALLGFGRWESGDCAGGLQSWSFQLQVQRQPPFHIVMFVVEEPVEAAPPAGRHCKDCQYVGWGQHMICNKKYHFVLPSKETMMAASSCSNNSNPRLSLSLSLRLVELEGHILHGVFHSNGFGHLLSLNGLEMGSTLPGYLVMDFWDRLCNALKARKVSLRDISQKRGMELRLLHGVAHGHPWFGRWGYKLHRAAFSATLQMYQKALSALQRLPVAAIAAAHPHILPPILSKYHSLSDHPLLTLRDLLRFVLGLHAAAESHNSAGFLPEASCRWSPKRVEMAVRVIVEALKRAEFRWVSRQEVRDAARMYIGDTGLLDFVLKSLGNHVVGNYLVRRTLNPVTKVLEYCLQDVCSAVHMKPRCKVGRAELAKDIFNLYRYILGDQKPLQAKGIIPTLTMASEIILDSKFLVKEYSGEPPAMPELEIEGKSNLFCTVRFKHQEATTTLPYECIAMKKNGTIDELKEDVERNMREIYWGLRSFVVEGIVDLKAQGKDLVFGLVEVGGKLVFEGNYGDQGISCLFFNNGGMEKRIMECVCGAVEDDGERMVACDICEIWQHTRCVQIPNDQQVPHIFICNRCDQEIALLHSLP